MEEKVSEFEEEFEERWEVVRMLGEGAFGKVYECTEKSTREVFAVKIIDKNCVKKSKVDQLRQEANILNTLRHDNVVKMYGVDETEQKIYIKMELVKGGTLGKTMKFLQQQDKWFTEEQSARIMRQILEGVAYIHNFDIIHRDIKPQNILIVDDKLSTTDVGGETTENPWTDPNHCPRIKLGDFGLSTQLDSALTKSASMQCGTLAYMAPEILYRATYTKSVDIWACAVIMYMLLNKGKHPFFYNKLSPQQYKKRLEKAVFPSLSSSRLANSLIQKMSRLEPLERYNASEVLLHPWITRRLNDEVPLSMFESFKGFEDSHKLHLLIANSLLLHCRFHPLQPVQKPSPEYMKQLEQYNQISVKSKLELNLIKSKNQKITSIQHIRQMFAECSTSNYLPIQNPLTRKKTQESQGYSASHPSNPKVEELNNIFTNLFEKRSGRPPLPLNQTTMALVSPSTKQQLISDPPVSKFEQTTFISSPEEDSSSNQGPCQTVQQPPQPLRLVQQQIEQSVKEFKEKARHKSRRIFSRNSNKNNNNNNNSSCSSKQQNQVLHKSGFEEIALHINNSHETMKVDHSGIRIPHGQVKVEHAPRILGNGISSVQKRIRGSASVLKSAGDTNKKLLQRKASLNKKK